MIVDPKVPEYHTEWITLEGRGISTQGVKSSRIPLGYTNCPREDIDKQYCRDLTLHCVASLNVPIFVEISIRTNGEIWWAGTSQAIGKNTYWHISRDTCSTEVCCNDYLREMYTSGTIPDDPMSKYQVIDAHSSAWSSPTKEQQEVIAKMFLGEINVFGLGHGLGHPPAWWALWRDGYTPASLSKKFGNGKKVFLA